MDPQFLQNACDTSNLVDKGWRTAMIVLLSISAACIVILPICCVAGACWLVQNSSYNQSDDKSMNQLPNEKANNDANQDKNNKGFNLTNAQNGTGASIN